jgi:LacI family transcriptional regulator
VLERRPRVAEVAARAGVSTATVDRVINGRGGVHARTVARVEQALREISPVGGRRRFAGFTALTPRFDILLPAESGRSTEVLGEELRRLADARRLVVNVLGVERINPAALAAALRRCVVSGSRGVAFQGVDHPLVRDAVDDLRRAGVPVLTLCSDVAGIDRAAYIGVDNRAAGRTAGWLMGRFCRAPGTLAVVWGGQLYRSHEERESGFRAVIRHDHPDLRIVELVDGNDDADLNYRHVLDLLTAHPDLLGLYCVGGGQNGVARALDAAGRARDVVLIGHNFNDETKPFLLSGTIDAIVHQDMGAIARRTLDALTGKDPAPQSAAVPVEIVTRENMMQR